MKRLAEYLNALDEDSAREALERCCGSGRWVEQMLQSRPFASDEEVYEAARQLWWPLNAEDWLEAFAHHPRIGQRRLEQPRFAKTASWSQKEQASTAQATEGVLEALRQGNRAYEEHFGHVFLICATGRSAEEMLTELEKRLANDVETEIRVAAEEQSKITRLRLAKLLDEAEPREEIT